MQKNSESNKQVKLYHLVAAALLTAVSVAMAPLNIYIPLFGVSSLRFSVTDIPIFICGILFGPILGAISGFIGDIVGFVVAPGGPYFPGFTVNKILVGFIPGMLFYLQQRGKNLEQGMIKKINGGLAIFALVGAAFYINVAAIEEVKAVGTVFHMPLNVVLTIGMILSVIILALIVKRISNIFEKKEGIYNLQMIIMAVSLNYIVVNLCLTPIWLYKLYNVPVFASVITRMFKSMIDVPLQVAICYTVLQAIPVKVRQKIVC